MVDGGRGDHGNLIDTANLYGRGAAEELLGDLLAGRPRDSYVLATKLYFPMSDTDRGLSRVQVRKQIDASLARLRVDHVDLYQCHRYDRDTPLEETMDALTEVVRAGKARYLGFSEWTAEQISAARRLPGVARFVSSQPQYSLLHRVPERAVIPLCRELGIGQIVFSPLAQGVLTGKYPPGAALPEDSRAASEAMGWAMGRFLNDDTLDAVQRLRPIASRNAWSPNVRIESQTLNALGVRESWSPCPRSSSRRPGEPSRGDSRARSRRHDGAGRPRGRAARRTPTAGRATCADRP